MDLTRRDILKLPAVALVASTASSGLKAQGSTPAPQGANSLPWARKIRGSASST